MSGQGGRDSFLSRILSKKEEADNERRRCDDQPSDDLIESGWTVRPGPILN